jgi:hypothetical protein
MKTINLWRHVVAWFKGAPRPRRLEDADEMLQTQIFDLRKALRK